MGEISGLALPDGLGGPGLCVRRCRVADRDVVWLRAVLEAYDGFGWLYGDGSGEVLLVTTESQAEHFDTWLAQVAQEAPITRTPEPAPTTAE